MSRGETIQTYGLAAAGMAIGLPKAAYEVYVQEPGAHHDQERSAKLGWGLLALGVFAWDMLAQKTLSEEVDDALEKNRALTVGAVAVVATHLLNVLPERVDPIHQFGKRARNMVRAA